MTRTQTARSAARHGVKRGMQVYSKYSQRWLPVIAAREDGYRHVAVMTEYGATLRVDWNERLMRREQ